MREKKINNILLCIAVIGIVTIGLGGIMAIWFTGIVGFKIAGTGAIITIAAALFGKLYMDDDNDQDGYDPEF